MNATFAGAGSELISGPSAGWTGFHLPDTLSAMNQIGPKPTLPT
jgi:hypothetical protein